MKFSKICIVAILCLCLMVGVVSADDNTAHKSISEIIKDRISKWTGWTFDKSEFQRLSEEWKADVKDKIRNLVTERGKSFEDRVKAQAYALGWDDRFDYVEKYGTIDYESGEITYDVPFWDGLFGGLGDRSKWFTTVEDYNEALGVYYDNYNAAVQIVPEVA